MRDTLLVRVTHCVCRGVCNHSYLYALLLLVLTCDQGYLILYDKVKLYPKTTVITRASSQWSHLLQCTHLFPLQRTNAALQWYTNLFPLQCTKCGIAIIHIISFHYTTLIYFLCKAQMWHCNYTPICFHCNAQSAAFRWYTNLFPLHCTHLLPGMHEIWKCKTTWSITIMHCTFLPPLHNTLSPA